VTPSRRPIVNGKGRFGCVRFWNAFTYRSEPSHHPSARERSQPCTSAEKPTSNGMAANRVRAHGFQSVGRERELVPGRSRAAIDAYSFSEIAKATGSPLPACSRIRAGTRVPHPRHWEDFERSGPIAFAMSLGTKPGVPWPVETNENEAKEIRILPGPRK
jgi:hypothetical protein